MTRIGCSLLAFCILIAPPAVISFEWSTGGRPEVNRHALAGLWRLTPWLPPIKEFTVYPKRLIPKEKEVLLMLKEDGSFQQYQSQTDMDVDESWSQFQQQRNKRKETLREDIVRGTWDFVDGKLILAADRSEKTAETRSQQMQDTLLEGRVVATYDRSLEDNPVVDSNSTANMAERGTFPASHQRSSSTLVSLTAVDVHLSVPKGSVKMGRFMYPKNHPSFFEQPMFQPSLRMAFSLKQVLGTLNARNREEEQIVEKYRREDFYNKTFLLTSHPIPTRRPKVDKPWSLQKKNQDPSKEEIEERSLKVRVMQVQFHRNNTFSTVAGWGEEAILRGKFDIIGHEKDQLWMQIWRFGFGRSVSGSVYSEGRHLTHEDAKTYWGTILAPESNEGHATAERKDSTDAGESVGGTKSKRLEVKGSVMFGWGLEPMPVARFILRELQEEDFYDEDEEDEEDQENMDIALIEDAFKGRDDQGADDNGIDWERGDAGFQ